MSTTVLPVALTIAAAFFDSLWEGVLIVGAVWLGLRCLPKLGAATRHAIWFCTLAALVLTPVLTVGLSLQPSGPATDVAVTGRQSGAPTAPLPPPKTKTMRILPQPADAVPEPGPGASIKSRIAVPQTLAVAVACIWMFVILARGFVLWLNIRALAAIRRDAWLWSSAHDYPVFLSNRVHVPLAAGFLRGVILLPAPLVEQLPADAVESIVIHEVAHLRRYDVWTNALARIAEAFLVFNPAVWFVMSRLSMEREIACDDWVVARTGAGEAFAQTLATMAGRSGLREPIAAPSAFGSRRAIVVRIERLLESRPRRLRLSPSALGGALTLLALIALTMQSVSPVLAYEPLPVSIAQGSVAPVTTNCTVPNRGIRLAYLLGPKRYAANSRPMNYELRNASDSVARFGASRLVIFDLTVDAAGRPRNVAVLSPPRYPGMVEHVTHTMMTSTYGPALHNCVAVAATIKTGLPFGDPRPHALSVIVPTYYKGWRADHKTACKVPTEVHESPTFPASMNNVPIDARYSTSVRVNVNAAGGVRSAAIVASSGQPAFDDAVLAAARRATYPLTRSTGFKEVLPLPPHGPPLKAYSALNCTPLPTDYVWHTEFSRGSWP